MKNFITFRSDMRKALVALLLMVSFSGFLKAQYVTIPDTAFVSWLHNNGLASCMSGNQLDTTCPALANITSLQCYNVPIKDLTGAQYFKSATELDCHNDSLYTIPALPPNLTLLTCYNNNLSTFPAFPASLTTIACWKNRFTTLPTLPPFLTQLECQQNLLTSLPALPATLTSLACYNNQLTSLPTLPDSLQGLYCQFNQLTALPSLPGTLTYLIGYNNLLSSIPALPPVMNQLFCYNNPNLFCLPRLTTIGTLEFDSAVVSCVPNYGTVTTSIPLVTHLPLCQPGNAHGCLTGVTAQITSGSSDTICSGSSVILTCVPSGGSSPYSFAWSPSVGISSVNTQVTTAGPTTTTTYTVTVTDASSSTATASVTITVNPSPQITGFTVTNLSCYGAGSGSVCPSVSGGLFPYTFMWSNFMSSQCISSLSAGNYSLIVTDSRGCQGRDSAMVTQPAQLHDSIVVTNTCTGSNVGTACVQVSGGTPNYRYMWSNTGTLQCIAGLAANSYSITVTDAHSCTATASNTVQQFPNTLVVDSIVTAIGNCAHGTACAYVSGGTPAYTYNWSNGATPQCITGLTQGQYTVSVTDINGCSVTGTANITASGTLQDTLSISNIACHGSNTGSACLYVLNGSSPYTYLWNNGETGQCITSLPAGFYTLTVTDANNCTGTASGIVTEPSTALHDSIGVTNVSCYGASDGMACNYTTGGTAGYTYDWAGGATASCITGVGQGTYSVTVTDANGCSSMAITTITQPAALQDSASSTNVTCFGGNNGAVSFGFASGGTPPYQYSINGITYQSSGQFTGLTAGDYILITRDSRGCTWFSPDTITQPAPIHDSLAVMNVSCYGRTDGSICIYSSGGTAPYVYQWSNSATGQCISGLSVATYAITVVDANSCTASSSTSINQPALISLQVSTTDPHVLPDTVNVTVTGGTRPYTVYWGNGHSNNLPDSTTDYVYDTAGIYNIGVIDAHNCSTSHTLAVDTTLPLVANAGNNATICLYNNIVLGGNPTATGGTAPYNYAWSDGLAATSNPVAAPSINHTYTLTVTDANSVSATSSITITVGPGLNANFSTPGPSGCLGSTTSFTDLSNPSAGISSWSWDFGNGNTSTVQNPIETFVTGGIYPVKLAVSNGICTADTIIPFTVNNIPTSSFTATSPVCPGQNATITYTGSGSGNGLYTWNFDGAIIASGAGLGPYQLNWGTAGTKVLTLSVTDNGCSSTITTETVTVNPLPGITLTPDTSVTCGGSVALTASGAITYSWSPATGLNATNTATVIATPATTTTYTVTGTAGNCGATASVTINVSTISDSIQTTNVSCFGANDGAICVYPLSGTAPYVYHWSNSATTQCMTGLAIATYDLTLIDANGCTTASTINVSQPAQLTLQVMAPDSNAVPDSVSLIIRGGTTPYSIIWDDGITTINLPDSTASHTYVAAGIYIDTITDANGCITTYRTDAGCTDQCVWPGDANYDGVVDNNDLLAIGVGYDTSGYARVNPTINFIPQYCQSWADTLIGAINYKHVDCNGDGIINADDTSAIMLNYSLTHARGGSGGIWKIDAPALYIKTSPDTIADGQILTATLSLGNASMPVANVYALAFTYNFDPLVVDTTNVQFSFGNSWLFGTGDHINISKNFYLQGQIQAAATRIDHTNRSGYGAIATVSMKITTGNINGKNLQYYFMNNFISKLTVIDNNGNILTVNAGTDSAVVSYTPTGIIPVKNTDANIQIFPNPASDQLNILSGNSEIEEITIVDLAGQQIIHQKMQAGNYSVIDIAELSAGVYMIKLKTGTEEYHSRFVKVGAK